MPKHQNSHPCLGIWVCQGRFSQTFIAISSGPLRSWLNYTFLEIWEILRHSLLPDKHNVPNQYFLTCICILVSFGFYLKYWSLWGIKSRQHLSCWLLWPRGKFSKLLSSSCEVQISLSFCLLWQSICAQWDPLHTVQDKGLKKQWCADEEHYSLTGKYFK